MRHGKKFNHLSRTASHRSAMLSNMASSLILHKRISTTVAKAKELRKYVEPLLTKSKEDTTHSRRMVFSYLNDKETVKTLFDEVAEKIAERPGGYTRIIKLGSRLGDNADMCIIELVDYNESLLKETTAKPKTRRSRRGGGTAKAEAKTTEAKVETETVETEKAEDKAAPEVKAEAADAEDTQKEEKNESKVEGEEANNADDKATEENTDK